MVKVHCDVCNIEVASEKWLEEHKRGKSHQKMVEKQNNMKRLAEKSVFLDGFKKLSASEAEIRKALSPFGTIDRIIINKKNGKSAIVELSSAESVKKLVEQKKLQVGEHKVNVKPRLVNFVKSETEAETTNVINQEDVLKFLQEKMTGSIVDDLKTIYDHYRRDATQFIDGFVDQIQTYVQEYFEQPIQVLTFGSTNTGLAIFDADVDLCFISRHHNETPSTSNGTTETTNDLMAQQITDLHKSKISLSAFNVLQRTDKVKLLTRILNEFRKEHGLICSITCVPDARCPIVRFSVLNAIKGYPNLPLNFEISVNNFLGIHKSLFTKNALNQDLSLILFLVRLWARCFKVFKDPAQPTGYWSSYALSLIFVNFCQLQGFISKVNICGTDTVKGWHIDYKIEDLPTISCSLDTFLMEFFKFLASAFNKPIILSPHYAQLYETQDAFKRDFQGKVADEFKFSLVNVQDPIELTHNVTLNVSQDYLKTLRGQSMRVICNLKADPEQAILGLFSKKSQQKPGTSKEEESDGEPSEKRRKM